MQGEGVRFSDMSELSEIHNNQCDLRLISC